MTALLIVLGLGDLATAAHFLVHHRNGLAAMAVTAAGWVAHRAYRAVSNPGRRVAPPEVQKELRAARRLAAKTPSLVTTLTEIR